MQRRFFLAALFLLGLATTAGAQQVLSGIPKPGARDLCPVCGMLVSKYPNWAATVLYKDGHAHHFDGAKDLFKYLQDLSKYAPGHRAEDMLSIAVTDFYNLEKIDARQALYVVGSDVLGPMGHELVPLATRTDANDFMKDHKGKRLLSFDQVTKEIAEKLDRGKFD
ncbi:MAG: copper chaperone NosL [Pseudomonadota bacterium]|nr:copper chaperone NosL [Pseudomonadota bacterium]MDQ5959822.1 copper chaperone NosL [Pseudomonadota bacterium]